MMIPTLSELAKQGQIECGVSHFLAAPEDRKEWLSYKFVYHVAKKI